MHIHPADLFCLFPAGQGTEPRARMIQDALLDASLSKMTVKCYVDRHPFGMNIYARCGNPSLTAPILEAHYDVANAASENCQDNTASVCHLLALANNPDFHGFLSFCDGEEAVDFERAGARWLNEAILSGLKNEEDGTFKVFDHVDRTTLCLELTAIGDMIWADHRVAAQFGITQFRKCPFNDAVILRAHGANAAQVSITPRDMFHDPYPETWKACHKMSDTFDKANRDDMAKFQEWLLSCSCPAAETLPLPAAPADPAQGR